MPTTPMQTEVMLKRWTFDTASILVKTSQPSVVTDPRTVKASVGTGLGETKGVQQSINPAAVYHAQNDFEVDFAHLTQQRRLANLPGFKG